MAKKNAMLLPKSHLNWGERSGDTATPDFSFSVFLILALPGTFDSR